MKDRQAILKSIRDPAPCIDCPERFPACSDRCPKDLRGERGHKAWKAEVERVKLEREQYLKRIHVRRKKYFGGSDYGKE